MKSSPKTILYFYPKSSTFIAKDLEIIAKHFELRAHEFHPVSGIALLFRFVNQFNFIVKNIGKADIIVCRFLGYHSFLPTFIGRLLGKPRLSIIGGTESHNYPSINYGSLRKPVYRWFTKMSFLNSTHIAPVHESLVFWEDHYYAKDFPKQGYRYFFPEIKVPYTEIYNGYDAQKFYRLTSVKKSPDSFITVASNFKGGEFYRKGVDLIIEAAKAFPQYIFTVVGKTNELMPERPNLHFVPVIPNKELISYFSAHEFYLQLSIAEGFPNALCEAMLCECIPIGSDVYGIPTIIGDTGFVLQKKDVQLLIDLIRKAVLCDKERLSVAARQRIATEFSLARREEKMINLLNQLIK